MFALTCLRDTFWTIAFENDADVLDKMADLHESFAESISESSPNSTWTMANMIQPLPTLFTEHGLEKGGNVLGLDRTDENLVCKSHWVVKSNLQVSC